MGYLPHPHSPVGLTRLSPHWASQLIPVGFIDHVTLGADAVPSTICISIQTQIHVINYVCIMLETYNIIIK